MTADLDFIVDAKEPLDDFDARKWDVFVSAYNDSNRVQNVYEKVQAVDKSWWVIPEYNYLPEEVAQITGVTVVTEGREADVIKAGLKGSGIVADDQRRLCFDITGLMRPQILFLMAYLRETGVPQFDFLYTEPDHYLRRSETRFSYGEDVEVRSISGFIGAHNRDTSGDILVLGVGYDHHLISHALQSKESSRIVQLHSFPSLSADMYHESLLRLDRVRSKRSPAGDEVYYSSANDPYVIARSLRNAISSVDAHKPITNVYLSPLATKPQAIGFGLYYLKDMKRGPASIIYPNCNNYERVTSSGVGRSWVYPINLENSPRS